MEATAIIRHHQNRITVLCPIGHVITSIDTGQGSRFAGSAMEAQLGLQAAGRPNVFDRQAATCAGTGHVTTTPSCDMTAGCHRPVTHLDDRGYVYCAEHGAARTQPGIRCRKLRTHELNRLRRGALVTTY